MAAEAEAEARAPTAARCRLARSDSAHLVLVAGIVWCAAAAGGPQIDSRAGDWRLARRRGRLEGRESAVRQ